MTGTGTGTGLGRKEQLVFLSMVMALAAAGIDVMLPAFDAMRSTFGLDPTSNEISRVVTAYLLGMAVAPVPYGLLSDRAGRRPVLWVCVSLYVVGAVLSALAPSLQTLLVARFVWGLGATGGRVVAFAVIRDTQEGDEMARSMSYIMAVFVLVPMVGPIIGSGIVAIGPWQGVFWYGALVGLAVLLWSSRLRETLPDARRQALRLGLVTKTGRRMAAEPAIAVPLLALVCIRGVMATYLASSQLIIAQVFGRANQFPYIFGAVAAVLGASALLNTRLLARRSVHSLLPRVAGVYLGIGGCCLAVTLIAGGRPPFWLFMPILAAGLGTQMLLAPNLTTLVLSPMAESAGTASALLATVSTAGGAVVGAFIDSQFEATVTPLATALAVAGALVTGLLALSARWITPVD